MHVVAVGGPIKEKPSKLGCHRDGPGAARSLVSAFSLCSTLSLFALPPLSSASFPGGDGDGGGALRHVFDFPRLPFLAATAGRAAKPLGSSSPVASAHQVCAPLHFPSCWPKRSTPNPSLSRSRSLPLAHAAAASGIPLSRGPLPPPSKGSGAASRAAGAAPQLGRKGQRGNAAAGETAGRRWGEISPREC